MGDGFKVFGVGFDEVVKGAVLFVDCEVELVPRGFDDLEENVVLKLVDEVDHLCYAAAGCFPVFAHFCVYDREDAASTGHAAPPCATEGEFNSFHAPEKVEDFEILSIRPRCDDDIYRSINFVLQSKDVPPCVSLFHLGESSIKATENIRRVELSVRASDSMLQLGGQGVSILTTSWSVQICR